MRLIPETAAELGSNIRWVVAKRLEIIEEIALGLQPTVSDIPDIHEAGERILRAVERRDRKAEDEAFVDRTRAEVWEWWQGFSERRLLTDLYRRAVLQEAGCGGPISNAAIRIDGDPLMIMPYADLHTIVTNVGGFSVLDSAGPSERRRT